MSPIGFQSIAVTAAANPSHSMQKLSPAENGDDFSMAIMLFSSAVVAFFTKFIDANFSAESIHLLAMPLPFGQILIRKRSCTDVFRFRFFVENTNYLNILRVAKSIFRIFV